MCEWIKGTIRPISLLTVFPVLLGALVTGTRIEYHIIFALAGAVFGVGFANSFNSLIDRKIDRLNPAKKTLAMVSPVSAWYGVLFLLPPLALCLRYSQYNHVLLSVLCYICLLYSYVFGNVPIVKRLTVAAVVAATEFLYIDKYNTPLWILAGVTFAFILWREGRKDRDDQKEDEAVKFCWIKNGLPLNWWYIVAPLLGATIYLSCFWLVERKVDIADMAIALGMIIMVWSYIQIRYKYGMYNIRLVHRTPGGRLGAVVALAGLMPSFASPVFVILAIVMVMSILYRSYLGRDISFTIPAIAHDAYLWASLPVMAMTKVGFHPILLAFAIALALITCAKMYMNRLAASPVA